MRCAARGALNARADDEVREPREPQARLMSPSKKAKFLASIYGLGERIREVAMKTNKRPEASVLSPEYTPGHDRLVVVFGPTCIYRSILGSYD